MRHQQAVELLLDQLRRLAAQYDLRTAQVGLEFIQRRFDLPAFVIGLELFFPAVLSAAPTITVQVAGAPS